MKTYFTSDLHLGHQRIIELCNRPFKDVAEMNPALISAINETVSSSERLVVMGDTAMGNWAESLEWLAEIQAAEVIFLPGNHCKWSRCYSHHKDAAKSQLKRDSKAAELQAAREGFKVFTEDEDWEWDRSWEFSQLSDEWVDHPLDKARYSHYPYDGDSWGDGKDRYSWIRPSRSVNGGQKVTPVIHGHVHDQFRTKADQFNVGVDVNGFKPVSEDELSSWVKGVLDV